MINVCAACGIYRADKSIEGDNESAVAICPDCGERHPFRRLPIFFLTGASGSGKTTLCRNLARIKTGIVFMESDILWREEFNDPENDYRSYRELWLRMAKNISQAGLPVMNCGCVVPAQIEPCVERRYFSESHYLALVCSSEHLEKRLRSRPEWRKVDDRTISTHVEFNAWIVQNAETTEPKMATIDTSEKTISECTAEAQTWIESHLGRDG